MSLLLFACGEDKKQESGKPVNTEKTKLADTTHKEVLPPKKDTSELEKKIVAAGLVNLKTVVPDIFIDLRYSTPANFMGRDLYGDLENLYVQPDVAEKVKKAQAYLKKQDSTLSLLVFDGVRPLSIQKKMWEEVKLPTWKKGKFLSNPAYGSIHNYGAAIDVSICTVSGRELDMGTAYDDTATLAYPTMEAHFLSTGDLKQEQVKHRQLLRKVMYANGFFGIQTEWWHFNACTRDAAKARYKLVD